jgi:hypothetical protein
MGVVPSKAGGLQLLELPMDLRSNPFSKSTFSNKPKPTVSSNVVRVKSSDEPFRFFDLPPELRNVILVMYFGKRTVAATFDGEVCNGKAKRYCLHAPNLDIHATAVLRVCKQLHAEAEQVLWDSTTFIIKVKTMHQSLSTLYTGSLHTGLPLWKLRHAIFNIELYEMWFDEEDDVRWQFAFDSPAIDALCKELAAGSGIKTAELHVDFGMFGQFRKDDGEWANNVFKKLSGIKIDRLSKISCVRLKPLSDDGRSNCVPFTDFEGFQALVKKHKA